ncbi:GNAT family N-acetyltransferase [Crateriforma spongiae]|uniref:GNAT family N-acetyltransferase n=1 Tax=Crateriforma spongiae TaxID=2724528 RepID=UPI0039B08A0B
MNTKERIQRALKAERGLRLSAAEVQGLASVLGVGFPARKPRRRKSPSRESASGNVRWMIRSDMKAVLAIDAASMREPWDDERYKRMLRQRNRIGMVIEQPIHGRRKDEIVGAMVYSLHMKHIVLDRMFVKRSCQLQSFGRQMMAKLQGKLERGRRTHLRATVHDSDLDALLFLQAVGFSSTASIDGQIELRFYVGDDARPFGQTSNGASRSRKG